MRILHVIPSLSMAHGGPSRAIRSMLRASLLQKIECLIATSDDDGPGRRLDCELGKVLSDSEGNRIYFPKFIETYKLTRGISLWLWRNVANFDACHVHALFSFSSTAGSLIALVRRVPLIVRPLGTLSHYGVKRRRPTLKRISLTLIERPILRRATAVHCTSDSEAADVLRIEPRARTMVVPLAVEQPVSMSCESAMSMFPQLSGRKVVLFLSRLDPKKNIEALLEGWTLLHPADPRAILVIAGGGASAYASELAGRAQALGIADHVLWTGNVDGLAKAALFRTARVFVLPSFAENFGVAAAEALSYGLPCIVSRGVALGSEIVAADAGKVVDPTPSALASAMTEYLDDDNLCRVQGECARKLAQLKYSEAALAERLQHFYQSIVDGPT